MPRYQKLPDGICIGAFPNPIEEGIGHWQFTVVGEGRGKYRKTHRKNYGKYMFKDKP